MLRSSCGGLVGLAASLLVLSCTSPSDPLAGADSDGAPSAMTKARVAARAAKRVGATALASDAAGVPRMMTATGAPPAAAASPEAAARHHLAQLAPAWLAGGTGADTELIAVHRLTGGASIVRFRQRIDGVEIHGGEVRMLLGSDGSLRAVTGKLYPATPANNSFRLDDTSAVSVALKSQFQVEVPTSAFSQRDKRGDYRTLALPPRTDLRVDALRTKQVYVPVDGKLTAAWFVELFGQRTSGSEQQARRFLVAADSGTVLRNVDLKSHEAFNYRVYAETTGDKRPLDGPIADWSPHPAGTPDGSYPAYIPPSLVSIDGFNEHGDPWLAADATTTAGNNVEVATDRNGDNIVGGADLRAETTRARTFDYTYDTAAEPMATPDQTRAALVHLFYTINWLHDWWYDSGFTEAAGNAQKSNLGRGGLENDVLIADGQDGAVEYPGATAEERGAKRDNANMSTPLDGMSPRMQMFLWTNNQAFVTLTPGGALQANDFSFGAPTFDLTAGVTLVNDGSTAVPSDAPAGAVGSVTDGCQAISTDLAGRIALLDRGNCNFTVKVKNAQNKGAVGVIVANNDPAGGPVGGTGEDASITIGVVGISLADGNALKAALAGGVSARIRRESDVELDGNLDTSVVAHEWGHYLHHRLSLCESTQQCGAMSEGWADFIALHLMARRGDDLDGAYGMALYDTRRASIDAGYFGLRRYPYSTDKTKNPLTFKHIADSEALPTTAPINATGGNNAQVHAAGEVWASMLWEAYVALLEAHDFEDARRRMGDYVVAGLLMAPDEATYTETRDALLIAAAAIDEADMARMAAAFAVRGAGPCAESPPPGSTTLDEVVESTVLAPNLVAAEVVFDDDVASCDDDGYLDPGETGTLRITVANASALAAAGVGITVTSAVPGITIAPATVGDLAPFAQQTVSLTVTAAADAPVDTDLAFTVAFTGVETCAETDQVIATRLGVDEQPEGSATDDMEARATTWAPTGANSELIWSREPVDTLVWNGLDAPVLTDTALVSPPLAVGKRNNLTISFRHRFQFETGPVEEGGEDFFFDGGVVEVSSDDGATWKDVTELGGEPSYGGELIESGGGFESENALRGHEAYVGTSPSAPGFDEETINLGKKLAGKTIRLRFRIATDQGTGAYGWDVDDVKIGGLTTTPFTAVLAEDGVCEGGVGVDAGPAQTVLSGAQVTLYGSTTLDGATPAWSRTAGADVSLSGGNTLTATFEAPDVDEATTVTLNLTVTAGAESLSDSVTITIAPLPPADPDEDDGGCCDASGAAGANLLAPLALVALAMARRRRRTA